MSSVCISNCVNDAGIPSRATYVNLHKWPESDAELVRTASAGRGGGGGGRPPRHQHPRVVDSISCRQLYLRSYTFSRKETVPERTRKCLARARERVARAGWRKREMGRRRAKRRKRCVVAVAVARRVKKVSCAVLCAVFHRMLSCAASVDVVEHRDQQ